MQTSHSHNFAELEDQLRYLSVPVGASECHGFICAQLCMNVEPDRRSWRVCLGAEGAMLETTLERVVETTRRALEAPDLSFDLMLPSDEATLPVRAEALAQWCRGFLFGLGNSGLTEAGLSGECRELVEDMDMISRARAELSDGEEFALMELIEYVRIGTLSVYHELRPSRLVGLTQQDLH